MRQDLFGLAVLALLGAAAAHPQTLTYVESSNGLAEPRWDGGYTEVEMGDVNADGRLDLVTIGDHGSPYINTEEHGVMVYRGDGAGNWSVVQTGNFGYGGVALGDADGDGHLDLGYGMHHNYSGDDLGDQLIEVARGDGSGGVWVPWDDGLATDGETYGMFAADFADVDADGDLDLASISFGCCNGWRVYLNQGDGTWKPAFRQTGGNSREEILFAEVNGDGRPDVVLSHDAGTVWLGDGSGAFVRGDLGLPGSAFRKGVAAGDVDGDGADDVAWVEGDGGPRVFGRAADGTWSDLGAGLPASGRWEAAQLWDLDGDGRTDLAAFGGGSFAAWRRDPASGVWSPMASFTTPSGGSYSAFRVGGDADHNGRADVVLVAEEGSGLNSRNRLRFFREASLADRLAVRFERPGAGAALRAGATSFIHWAAAVPGGEAARVALAYSLDGGAWTPIAAGLPNSGRHQWTAPAGAGGELRLVILLGTANGGRVFALGPALRLLPGV